MARAPLQPLPMVGNPFDRISMDIFGPLKRTASGNRYILIAINYNTKWPEVFALKNATADTIADSWVNLSSRVGLPEELLTDNGTNFIAKVMYRLCTLLGIKRIKISPYHPQTDVMVEQFNSTVKRLLRKLIHSSGIEWDKCLPFILWAYRGTPHKATGFSPYHLLYGLEMKKPLD